MKSLMSKTTFSEICKLMKDKDQDIKDCVSDLFGVALLFLPGAMCREAELLVNFAAGATILDAKNAIEQGIKKVGKVFSGKNHNDFSTKYEHAQIAQVLIVFSAYFDTVKQFLPDADGQIQLSDTEKYHITEESLLAYMSELKEKARGRSEKVYGDGIYTGTLWECDLSMPNPVESLGEYLERLEKFYKILNHELEKFYERLSFVEEMSGVQKDYFSAVLREMPRQAVISYKKQYYELAASFPDFFVWSNIQEHSQISQKIDVGFEEMKMLLKEYCERNADTKAARTLERYTRKYQHEIEKTIFDAKEMECESVFDVVFPMKKDIFVPQSFKVLQYKEELALEQEVTWEKIPERDNIGKFIGDILRNPELGELPMLILGHPGAGKSLLCNMLAAEILHYEYHVILIHLRDTIAEESIAQQIDRQIKDDFGGSCTWRDIVDSHLSKPILLIFDGYDELLQASGKTYADYLQRIAEFQNEEKAINDVLVKCIVTSRTTLINRVNVMKGSPIIRLCDFDMERIQVWISIWNEHNKTYFKIEELQEFEIQESSKVFELSKQPLLLSMLALYDSRENALRKQNDLKKTQLYDQLIREFVMRERRKDEAFRALQDDAQEAIVQDEVEKIGIAALGMYNRKVLYIHAEELERDTNYIRQEYAKEQGELKQSEKRLASFFFIHRSDASKMVQEQKVKCSAYEFLHNTFGEFLTADYIVKTTNHLLGEIQKEEPDFNKYRAWCVGLAYAPLFSRYVVVKMIEEWSSCASKSELESIIDTFIDEELQRVVSGESVAILEEITREEGNPFEKQEVFRHLGIYSMNLVILKSILFHAPFRLNAYVDQPIWEKLVHLWRQTFAEDELADFANSFSVDKRDGENRLSIEPGWYVVAKQPNRADKLHDIAKALRDDVSLAFMDVLDGSGDYNRVMEILIQEGLDIKGRFWWNYILKNMGSNDGFHEDSAVGLLSQLRYWCLEEGDMQYIFAYYMLLHFLLKQGILKLDKTEMNQVILSDTLSVSVNFAQPQLVPYRQKAWDKYIQQMMLELLDYLTVDEYCVEEILGFYLEMRGFIEYSSSNALFILQICNKVLGKVAESNKKVQREVKRMLRTQLGEKLQTLVFRGHPGRWSMRWFEETLQLARCLLKTGVYDLGKNHFMECMQIAYAAVEKRGFTHKQKYLILNCLRIMHEKELEALDYAWEFERVVVTVSMEHMWKNSPETLADLCYLLEYVGVQDRKAVVENKMWVFVQKHKSALTLEIYKSIRRWAVKEADEKLLKTLEVILE